ncbi:MAG: VWA domain-containing protein [Acidobacteria bacterium]|nr:VWA domain-containing protein [Acidobacteriota bacterium]
MKFQNLIGILSLLFAFAFCVFAQTPQPTPPKVQNSEDDGEIIKVESRLVIVPVSVTDPLGQPILGLKAQDFRILEDNKSQEIAQVSDAEKVPLEIALLIDVSGSVNPLFEFEKKAAAQFLESVMKPDDKATIFLIGDQPSLAQERDNAQRAAIQVRAIVPSGKFTAFYDTVTTAARYLQKNAPVRSRRVILALTDGEDNWSNLTREAEKDTYSDLDVNTLTREKLNKLAAKTDSAHRVAQDKILRDLQNADTVFYVINPAGDSFRLNKISTRAQNGLQKFAGQTGGTAFLPNFLPTNLKDQLQNSANTKSNEIILAKIFRSLANELQAQYLVQYYSEGDFPNNKYVKLNVNLTKPEKLRIRARQGYFVKN